MSYLQFLAKDLPTDKDTNHSYLPVYEQLFDIKKTMSVKHLLEIGIAEGGSVQLWRSYFPGKIYAVDNYHPDQLPEKLKSLDDVFCFPGQDAYSPCFLENLPKELDLVIDDGPHTLHSQQEAIRLYVPRLSKGGILVIEDVQDIKHIDLLKDAIPDTIKTTTEVHDLRNNKNRPDDILFIIHKK